tara:strand:- start:200 stop:436 length:237 start_codon:yes stop_codon:yes gene_type:complete
MRRLSQGHKHNDFVHLLGNFLNACGVPNVEGLCPSDKEPASRGALGRRKQVWAVDQLDSLACAWQELGGCALKIGVCG